MSEPRRLLDAMGSALTPDELATLVADYLVVKLAEARTQERERIAEALKAFCLAHGINPAGFLAAIAGEDR